MLIELFDRLGYLIHTTDVENFSEVIIWGTRAFIRTGSQYQEASLIVLQDTDDVGLKA